MLGIWFFSNLRGFCLFWFFVCFVFCFKIILPCSGGSRMLISAPPLLGHLQVSRLEKSEE